MRRFFLKRLEDPTGVSGTGVVAWGAILPSGKCVLEWTTQYRSIAIYDSPSEIVMIHGHEGRTVLVWVDAV